MSQSPVDSRLHPLLRAYPGAVIELAADGSVGASNGRLEARLGGTFSRLLDAASAAKVRRLLDAGSTAAQSLVELGFEGEQAAETLPFHACWAEDGGPRLWLMEVPRHVAAERAADELTAMNTELVNAQRDLAKKSGHLSRLVEEIELKLGENERLSEMLQYQNEEMESQNEELLAMTEELHAGQDELLKANHDLERRTRELQVALSARNRFYAAMSHELRTPINAVMGYNDLLLVGIYGPLNEQQELAVERSQRAVCRLRDLVNDVLDISKIELGKMEIVPEPVELREMVESLFVAVAPMAESQGSPMQLAIEDCPGELVTDRRCLRHILMNLLMNAIKLGAGQPVSVRCAGVPEGLVIEVSDNGEGMDMEDLAAVFEEFAPIGDALPDSPVYGTGLGLPIAHRLAALIGGRLEASTSRGIGNVFRLFLPVDAHLGRRAD